MFWKKKKELTEEEQRKKELDDISTRLWYIYGWFVLTIFSGIYTIAYPKVMGLCFLILGFLIFNSVMFIYKILLISTKRILKENAR